MHTHAYTLIRLISTIFCLTGMAAGGSFVWVGPPQERLVRISVTVALFVYFLVSALRHRSDQRHPKDPPTDRRQLSTFLVLAPLIILVLIIALTRLAVPEQVWRMQTMVSTFVVILGAILGQVIGDLIKARSPLP
jgi:uncharacterized membrane protein